MMGKDKVGLEKLNYVYPRHNKYTGLYIRDLDNCALYYRTFNPVTILTR